MSLGLKLPANSTEIVHGPYIYHAIATNRDKLSDSEIIQWYRQRAEDCGYGLKELNLDFGGDAPPCSDLQANMLYFLISALSYNIFALLRQLLPGKLGRCSATAICWRLYAMSAKVVKTGRQMFVKLNGRDRKLLDTERVLPAMNRIESPPP